MIRVFVLPFQPGTGCFEEDPVNRFMFGKKVLAVQAHFFVQGGQPYWTVLLDYDEILSPQEAGAPEVKGLNEWQRILYQKLREWRKSKAEEQGIPGYLVATNGELQKVVTEAPDSLEKLKSIRGFGSKKVERYGTELVEMVRAFFEKKE